MLSTLNFKAKGKKLEKLEGSNFEDLVNKDQPYSKAKFWFRGNEWRGCTKVASFFLDGTEHVSILGTDDTCDIPKEALVGRKFYVSVTGLRYGFKIKTNKVEVSQI